VVKGTLFDCRHGGNGLARGESRTHEPVDKTGSATTRPHWLFLYQECMHYIIIVVTYLLHVPKVGEVHSACKRAAGGNDKQGDWHGAKPTGFSIVLVSSKTRDRRLELAIAARRSANGKLKSGRSGVAIAGLGEVQGRRPDAECRGRLPTKRGRTPARARDRPTQIGTPRA
jgi:hypothetical protein